MSLVLLEFGCVRLLTVDLGRFRATAILLILQIVLILGASTLFGGRACEVLALRRPEGGWRAYAKAFLMVPSLVGYALVLIILAVLGLTGREVTLQAFPPFWWEDAEWALWLGVTVVLSPVWEELLFRGFLLPALAQMRLGFWGAALVASGAWAAFHGSLLRFVPIFAIGMLLSWLLWRTGSLRVPIFIHAVNNLIVVLAPFAGLPDGTGLTHFGGPVESR